MSSYSIVVHNVKPEDHSLERVEHGLKSETLSLADYGEVAEVTFSEPDPETGFYTVEVRMEGATEEFARRMAGRVYHHLDHEGR